MANSDMDLVLRLTVDGEDELTCTLGEFIDANDPNHEVTAWARTAAPGQAFTFGGGAATLYTVTVLL